MYHKQNGVAGEQMENESSFKLRVPVKFTSAEYLQNFQSSRLPGLVLKVELMH